MKKILLILALVLSMLASFTAAYADTAVPYYIGTNSHRESFKISSTGTAEMSAALTPHTSDNFDKVNIEMKIKKPGVTTPIYSGDWDTTYDKTSRTFKKSTTHRINNKGTYYMEVTYTCYSGDELIETITTKTSSKTY